MLCPASQGSDSHGVLQAYELIEADNKDLKILIFERYAITLLLLPSRHSRALW